MNFCLFKHDCCTTEVGPLPWRVLDVASAVIRLQETSGEQGKYVALSHCWGTHPCLTTTSGTLVVRKREIDWQALGRTFQDAITLTRHLGLKYIWIDSLCIVQDSVADWEVELARMGAVYRHATFTIAASRAADGTAGLFREVSQTPYIWRRNSYDSHHRGSNQEQHQQDVEQSPYVAVQHPDIWKPFPIYDASKEAFWMSLEPTHDVLDHKRRRPPFDILGLGMPLFTRAWFLQERLMSPRILHFGAMELYWECDRGMVCECLAHNINRHDLVTRKQQTTACRLYSSLTRFSSTENKLEPLQTAIEDPTQTSKTASTSELDTWQKLIEEYSRLLLTRETDRLPALSGIANTLWKYYLAGIWTSHLPRCFYWTTDTTCNVFVRRPFEYRAPSFSWASIEGPINYYNWLSKRDKAPPTQIGHVVATVVGKDSTAKGLDPSGQISRGYVTLLCYAGLATVTNIYTDASHTICEISRDGMENAFQLDIPICLVRREPTEIQLGESVLVILLECEKRTDKWSVDRFGAYRLCALVVKANSPEWDEYRRVALIEPSDDSDSNGDILVEESVRGPRRMHTDAPGWFDKKREVRLV